MLLSLTSVGFSLSLKALLLGPGATLAFDAMFKRKVEEEVTNNTWTIHSQACAQGA